MSEIVKTKPNIGLTFSGELASRISRIYARLGYRSITSFVEKAVMDKLPMEERRFDQVEEALKSGEAQKWEGE